MGSINLPDIGLVPPAFKGDEHEEAPGYGDGIMNFEGSGTSEVSALGNDDADNSSRTHDQLPAVEAYKAQGTVSSKAHQGKRMIKIYLTSLLTIIFLTILICVVAILGNRRSQAIVEKIAKNATQIEDAPRLPRLAEVLDYIGHVQEWSDPSKLAVTDSPQYLAARWIADLDPRDVSMDEVEEFRTRYVLALFYYAMNGDRWEHEVNWMTLHSYCNWNNEYPSTRSVLPIRVGVECDPASGNTTVTKIFLPSLDLQGELPSELRLLLDLEVLDLYTNDISGGIPVELQWLTNLKKLVLHNNHMGGPLPKWIDQWKDLETLDLAINKFTGSLPTELAALSKLEHLSLEHNQITGSLEVLSQSESLKLLALGNNKITGALTEDMLSTWFRLADLDLSDNEMGGTLPSNLLDAQSLVTIDLHGNKFYGTIPFRNTENNRLEFLALVRDSVQDCLAAHEKASV